jgi:hypothetical protein
VPDWVREQTIGPLLYRRFHKLGWQRWGAQAAEKKGGVRGEWGSLDEAVGVVEIGERREREPHGPQRPACQPERHQPVWPHVLQSVCLRARKTHQMDSVGMVVGG